MTECKGLHEIICVISQPQTDVKIVCFNQMKDNVTTTSLFLCCSAEIGPRVLFVNEFHNDVPSPDNLFIDWDFQIAITNLGYDLCPDNVFPLKDIVVLTHPNVLAYH